MKTKLTIILITVILLLSCTDKENIDDKIDDKIDSYNIESAELIQIFPSSHPINKDISNDPVDPNSDAILNLIGLDQGLFPDFGSGTWEGAPIGIPYIVVGENQPLADINYVSYGDESDPGPFPIPLNAPIEGNGNGDAHVLCVNVDTGMLYELYNAAVNGNKWNAASGAKFNLNVEEYRPSGWTSADAAGLPIFPCLVRYPEVKKGEINHAIRFTLPRLNIYEGYVHPARHLVTGTQNSNQLPFGGRLRLKPDFDISGFSENNQVILRALKKYGLILADVGSAMFISGAPHDNWDNSDLKELKSVKVSDFEVIELGAISAN